jgi:hypothetical protein
LAGRRLLREGHRSEQRSANTAQRPMYGAAQTRIELHGLPQKLTGCCVKASNPKLDRASKQVVTDLNGGSLTKIYRRTTFLLLTFVSFRPRLLFIAVA